MLNVTADALRHSHNSFSFWLNKYSTEENVSCSRTQHNVQCIRANDFEQMLSVYGCRFYFSAEEFIDSVLDMADKNGDGQIDIDGKCILTLSLNSVKS